MLCVSWVSDYTILINLSALNRINLILDMYSNKFSHRQVNGFLIFQREIFITANLGLQVVEFLLI